MKKFTRVLFPSIQRDFFGKRWLKITLRTLHLIGVAGVAGGILLDVPAASWQMYLLITVLSGVGFILLELWSNAIFIIQLRGLIIFVKLALLFYLYIEPQQSVIVLLVIVLSSVVSHAPGNFRYFSLFHGRRIDSL